MSGVLLSLFNRLSLTAPHASKFRQIHTTSSLFFQITPPVFAEPLKKKKKIDPQILKQREERKRKKIEKQIKRLERNARQLKPIDELEVPLNLLDEKKMRTRPAAKISDEVMEKRKLLEKQWAKFRMNEKLSDYQLIDRIVQSQEKALAELKYESEELYLEAIQPDLQLLPFSCNGPLSTPPLENYESPDGEYIDVSKKWE